MWWTFREHVSGDKEKDSSYENDDDSVQQSMECDSVVDVTEDGGKQDVEHNQSEEIEDKIRMSRTNYTGKYFMLLDLNDIYKWICFVQSV